jgi:uncharacterized membrane-anchored protein
VELLKAGVPEKDGSKLAETLAGLLPADLIAGHALILATTTKITESATGKAVEITGETALRWAAPGLVLVALLLFCLGVPGTPKTWDRSTWQKALVPPLAISAWMLLANTSALTPFIASWASGLNIVAGVLVGLVTVGLANRLAKSI